MIEVNRDGEVWIFAEQQDGKLNEVSLELLGKGLELAGKLGVKAAAVLPGHGVEPLVAELSAYGAQKVYVAEAALLKEYQTTSYAKALCELIGRHKPQIVLYGATAVGRDLAPRVASAMRAGLTADCTDLQIEDFEIKKTNEVHKNLLQQIRPAQVKIAPRIPTHLSRMPSGSSSGMRANSRLVIYPLTSRPTRFW